MVFFHKVYASLKGSIYKIYLNIFSRDKFLPLVTAKIIFDDLGNFSLSGRGASEKPSVEENNSPLRLAPPLLASAAYQILVAKS